MTPTVWSQNSICFNWEKKKKETGGTGSVFCSLPSQDRKEQQELSLPIELLSLCSFFSFQDEKNYIIGGERKCIIDMGQAHIKVHLANCPGAQGAHCQLELVDGLCLRLWTVNCWVMQCVGGAESSLEQWHSGCRAGLCLASCCSSWLEHSQAGHEEVQLFSSGEEKNKQKTSQAGWFHSVSSRWGFRLRWWQGREWYCQLLLMKLFCSDRIEIWNHKWDCLTKLCLQMQYYEDKLSVTFFTSGYWQIKQVISIAIGIDAILSLSHIFCMPCQ